MAFNKDIPTAGTSLRASNPQILENQESIQEAVDNEHIFSGTDDGTQTGDHTQGSARCFSQATAPATRIDGDGFLSTDLGSLWIDTDDNAIYVLTATTPTWTPISTELYESFLASPRVFLDTLGVTGDFAVNTDKFTVAATSGNTLVAGTFESTGVATLADGSVTKTTAPPTTDPMITNKKYVDDKPINGTLTAVFTKYLKGTTDNDAGTSVAHGISGIDNILDVSVVVFDGTSNIYRAASLFEENNTLKQVNVSYDGTNVILSSVGANMQGEKYRIRLDYQ